MNILYWDTSKGALDKLSEALEYLQKEGITDILVLPDYAYLQTDCPKEQLIWWRDRINEIIEEKDEL